MALENGTAIVSQAEGYGVTVGLGAAFAIVILLAVYLQRVYLSEKSDRTEMFMVANRSVGIGLTTSAVFSSWMWINETVYCSLQTYKFGIALPVWWSAGLTFQIALMAVLGVAAKIRIPHAHTSLEIARIRYGRLGHVAFMILCLVLNILGCSNLLFNGSVVLSAMTGMHFVASTLLLPAGVIVYTVLGGIKATFLTDFLHTAIALILMIYFTLGVLTSDKIGGLSGLYDKLIETAGNQYIEGNYDGSLLTFRSQQSAIWGVMLKFANLALVVMDTAFWQKSFAAEADATVPAYDLASIAIFAIPWGLGTVIGLACRAIEFTSIFPTNGMSTEALNDALVMPYTVYAVLGRGAAGGIVVLIFMAVTSTLSSTFIGVGSILSFDLYRTYFHPQASDKHTVRASHISVILFGFFLAGFTIMLKYAGADIDWVNYAYAVITVPGIIPIILTLFWKDQSKLAFIGSSYVGLASGLAVWLSTAWYFHGEVTITTTKEPVVCLYGVLTSFFTPAIYSVLLTLIKPQNFDWRTFLKLELLDDQTSDHGQLESSEESEKISGGDSIEKDGYQSSETEVEPPSRGFFRPFRYFLKPQESDKYHPFSAPELLNLRKWLVIATIFLIVIILLTFVLWPMPLYRNYIFNKPFFSGWVVMAIIWQFFALLAVVVFPIFDGRHALRKCFVGLLKELHIKKSEDQANLG